MKNTNIKVFLRRHFRENSVLRRLMENILELLKCGLAQNEEKCLKDNQESVK